MIFFVTQQQYRRFVLGSLSTFRSCLVSNARRFKSGPSESHPAVVLAAAAVLSTTTAVITFSRSRLDENTGPNTSAEGPLPSFRIEVDFMDRLANKSYLRLYRTDEEHRSDGAAADRYLSSRLPANVASSSVSATSSQQRPLGVPNSLRVLSVDVPELRLGFRGGECSVALDRVFPDGVAAPKKLQVLVRQKERASSDEEKGVSSEDTDHSNNSDKQSHSRRFRRKRKKKKKEDEEDLALIEVDQKAWVTSMFECWTSSRGLINPGVLITEANTRALNPRLLRRTFPFSKPRVDNNNQEADENQKAAASATIMLVSSKDGSTTSATGSDQVIEDELDAPWNQYAWLEEMELRISGRLPFAESLEPAPWHQRWLFGNVYYHPSITGEVLGGGWGLGWLLPGAVKGRRRYQQFCDDNKPHAVIAHRGRLQRVPHALRRLQATCKKHGVPLYIVDSELGSSSGKTFLDLGPVLRQVRAHTKRRVVMQSLRESSAWAYDWGRRVGRLETETKHLAQQLSRQVTQAIKVVHRRHSSKNSNNVDASKKVCTSWSKYDTHQLEQALIERSVVVDGDNKKDCNEALLLLAQRCLERERQKAKNVNEESVEVSDSGATTPAT